MTCDMISAIIFVVFVAWRMVYRGTCDGGEPR